MRDQPSDSQFVELCTTTNFTFLTGASHPDELVVRAAALGYSAIGVTDTNTLAGIVRAHVAAKEADVRLVVGCRLRIDHVRSLSIRVYPTDRDAYARLCTLLTVGKRRAPKGECHLTPHDVFEHAQGLIAIVDPPRDAELDDIALLRQIRTVFDDDRLSLSIRRGYRQDDADRVAQVADLADHLNIPLVATNDTLYHAPDRRMLQDVITCIRHGCTIEQAGLRLQANAERHLKPPEEMVRLFADYPEATARTVAIADRCAGFNLDQLRYEYPSEVIPPDETAMGYLRRITWEHAEGRYASTLPGDLVERIEHELALIEELGYAHYFLTVYDLVNYARSRDILCQGRGAAANSAVCYCLGITSVDPQRIDLLFERFISKERDEPPDIDIDFEHERREEVIQYVYEKYGRHRAALCAEVVSYRGRSAVREVGKALGLSLDLVDRLAKCIDHVSESAIERTQLEAIGLNPDDPTLQHLSMLVAQIRGFPRHLSQHVGGFVITQQPLCELVPIENAAMPNRTVIEWDKDDIDAMGMLKVDCLGLGMLTCIRKAFDLIAEATRQRYALHSVPAEDPFVYDMICAADTVGVFQIESRAQMSMLPRLRPRKFYDLVIEVAIVRPGPIQGDMVHPYLRRRDGDEPVEFPDDLIRGVLGRTLGVPLFQEQAMRLSVVAAGFTPGEADQLRRAINAWKTRGNKIEEFGVRIINGMMKRGYTRKFAEQCFTQIKGFSGYGFPESHAASFALLVYVSAWLKRHHPAAFAAALLNSQPMGFYAPAQIVRDAQEHGVTVKPVDVNRSDWDCTLEGGALRLGMRRIKGMREDEARAIVQTVGEHGVFGSIESLWRTSGVRAAAMRKLARADAFTSMGIDRQHALWQTRALRDQVLPLFEDVRNGSPSKATLPAVPGLRKVVTDYETVGLSLRNHPIAFVREQLDAMGVTAAGELADEKRWPNGRAVRVAGLCLLRQRPSTAKGITFMTLEDETGIANLVVRPAVYKACRPAARGSGAMVVRGKIERKNSVVHVLVFHIDSADDLLRGLLVRSRDFR